VKRWWKNRAGLVDGERRNVFEQLVHRGLLIFPPELQSIKKAAAPSAPGEPGRGETAAFSHQRR
jgi:hypothetical protein